MLKLFTEHTEQIRAEAIAGYPLERVWLITSKGLMPVKNVAEDPSEHFEVAPKDLIKARKQGLLAVVHSHVNGLHYPSVADMTNQEANGVPWGLVCTDGVGASEIRWWGGSTPDQIEDLEGRTFCHGTADCYALVRDYYKLKLDITLPVFPRKWMWWDEENLLEESFPKAGFFKVTEPREHDVWLASFNSSISVLNHCGVYLGNDLTQHHPGAGVPVSTSRKAVITPIHRYLPNINVWIRHKDLA
jgi:proteasome lid subunit RPN8/RPN11